MENQPPQKRTMGKRIYREPTAEQAAKYRKIRAMIAAEIPEIKQEARAIRHGRRAGLDQVIGLLKAERELRGMSLADLGEKTGLSKSAISKLETNPDANPTVNTLARYADALDMSLSVILTEKK
ncbi:MAG: family transcriptional regulator [Planctomycetaceae bacterium]|nr:family transcriptional regulator [Planctomycetaceae bacterium]